MPTHLLLTIGNDQDNAQDRVRHFFAGNFLVKYDLVSILAERTIPADHAEFWRQIEAGSTANRRLVGELVSELEGSGFEKLADLPEMRQGYHSKLLHTICHLLDGFFGVDTVFYNLEEDAHGVSDRLAATIKINPGAFWLVQAECDSNTGHDPDQLDLIRQLKTEPPT